MKDKTTLFGCESIIPNFISKVTEDRDNFMFDEITNTIKHIMPRIVIDREKLERWVNMCINLDVELKKKGIGGFVNEIADNVRYSKELKVETAWVIQRDDGKFFKEYNEFYIQFTDILDCEKYDVKPIGALNFLERHKCEFPDELKNLRIVKIELKVVEE